MNTYEKLLASLVEAGVQFMTVGALACAFNGLVRATLDVDIVIARTPENVRTLLGVLSRQGSGAARELCWEDFDDAPGAVRIIEEFPIDVFVRIGGFTYEELLPWRREYPITHLGKQVAIPYVSADGLIAIKSSSYREQDRLDVAMLRRLREEEQS